MHIHHRQKIATSRFFLIMLTVMSAHLTAQERVAMTDVEIQQALALVDKQPEKAIALVTSLRVTPYNFGRNLVTAGKTEEALTWYVALTIATDDPQYVFGKAWTHWRKGEVHQALEDGAYLLTLKLADKVLARTHYMLGMIHLSRQGLKLADKHIAASLTAYRKLGMNGGQYLCHMARAFIALERNAFDHAEASAELALSFNNRLRSPYSLGKYYEVYSSIHFSNPPAKPNFAEALHYAALAQAEFEKSGENEHLYVSLATQGLLHAFLGDFEAAFRIATKVDDFGRPKKYAYLGYYNSLTWMYLHRCNDLADDVAQMKVALQDWSKEKQNGKRLERLLYLVENIPCP